MKLNFLLSTVVWFALAATTALPQEAPAAPATGAPAPAPAATAPPPDTAPATNAPAATPAATNTPPAAPAPAVAGATAETAPAAEPPAENRGPLTLDHELPAAIQFLARMANLNIHVDPSITFTNAAAADGRSGPPMVSLRWDNVTAEDALQEVLDIHGLTLINNPKTKISRVTRKPTLAPLVTSIIQLKHSHPTNMVDLIRTTFTEPNRSKVTADPRTGQLLIVTTQKDLDNITNLLTQLDIPTKQVLIEARLLETAKNPKSIKGIDWSGTLEGQQVTFGNGRTTGITRTENPGATAGGTLPSGRTVTSSGGESSSTTLNTLVGAGGISADTMRGFYPSTAFLNADGVSAVLSFLNTDNDTEVVATPRAVTADNQMAMLEVTRAFPIFQITPGTAQTPAGAQVTYTNVGTILKVTPRISANSNIALKVIPEVSNIDSKDVQIVNGTRNEANVYAIRRIEADVVVPSGNTLVMGGLISDNKSKSYKKVPILGDLPGVGMAFRQDAKSRSKANLLIFVTPTIIHDDDFQPSPTDFLKTKPKDSSDEEESWWDRGKPKDWSKSGKTSASKSASQPADSAAAN